jgi:hypothetical protein
MNTVNKFPTILFKDGSNRRSIGMRTNESSKTERLVPANTTIDVVISIELSDSRMIFLKYNIFILPPK